VVVTYLRRQSGQRWLMPADSNGRSAAAQAALDVLRAAGSVVGLVGRRRVKDAVVQQATQLAVWEDEGGPVVEPPPVPPANAQT
jgi:glutathione S-transferase